MPAVPREQIGVALDMFGCPNRCRHCWLGPPPVYDHLSRVME